MCSPCKWIKIVILEIQSNLVRQNVYAREILKLPTERTLCRQFLEHILISGNPQCSTLLICSTCLKRQRSPGPSHLKLVRISGDPQWSPLFSLSSHHYMKVQGIILGVDPLRLELPHLSFTEAPSALKDKALGT